MWPSDGSSLTLFRKKNGGGNTDSLDIMRVANVLYDTNKSFIPFFILKSVS